MAVCISIEEGTGVTVGLFFEKPTQTTRPHLFGDAARDDERMTTSEPGTIVFRKGIADLRLPILQAPMFLVSSCRLARATCEAGMIGSFQLANPDSEEMLSRWLDEMSVASRTCHRDGMHFAPYCVNINANSVDRAGYRERVDLCEAAQVPLVLSSIGDPSKLVRRVHAWGGRVIHDVTTLRFADKAIEAGADGLMLTCAGAGGHNGTLSPFAFLPQVRSRFDGLIVLAGGIAEASGIQGALAMGADLVCMGTRFVATQESAAPDGYKQMLVDSGTHDIIETDAIAGLTANWLRPSLVANGLDPDGLPKPKSKHRPNLPDGVRAWKTIWSAGHSTGLVEDVPRVLALADRLAGELGEALAPGWQAEILRRLGL
jgi:nitronate monooxygenase